MLFIAFCGSGPAKSCDESSGAAESACVRSPRRREGLSLPNLSGESRPPNSAGSTRHRWRMSGRGQGGCRAQGGGCCLISPKFSAIQGTLPLGNADLADPGVP